MTPTVTLNDGNTIPVLGLSVAELPPADAEAAVSAALDAGYRLIDTAAAEGNEEAVGRAIASSGIPRDELYVTTKLATADQGFQSSQDACKASLERLSLDYVDLYLIHWPAEENGKYIDAWGGIMKSKELGHARSIGVSNFSAEHRPLAQYTGGKSPGSFAGRTIALLFLQTSSSGGCSRTTAGKFPWKIYCWCL